VYGSPDNLGLLYDRVLPVWLARGMLSPFARRARTWWWPLALVLFPVLFLTYSRGAWAGVAAGCVLVLALALRRARWLLVAVAAVAILGGALEGPKIVNGLTAGHAHTVERRLDIWRSVANMVRDHPILGIGPDNFIHYYAPRTQLYIACEHGLGYMQPAANQEPCESHPHNEVFDFWLSTGLVGLLAYGWLLVLFYIEAVGGWYASRDPCDGALTLGQLGAMTAAIVHGAVDNSYFLVDLATIFWLLLAVVFFIRSEQRATAPSVAAS